MWVTLLVEGCILYVGNFGMYPMCEETRRQRDRWLVGKLDGTLFLSTFLSLLSCPTFPTLPLHCPHPQMATFLRLTNELIDVAAAAASSWCSSVEAGERGLEDITEDLLPLLAPDKEADSPLSVITTFVKLLQQGSAALLETVRGLGHCACLPSHRSSWDEIEAMISGTVNAIEALCQGNDILHICALVCPPLLQSPLTCALTSTHNLAHGAPPSIILIARSVRDGYTPPSVVGALQVCKVWGREGGIGRRGSIIHGKGEQRSYSEACSLYANLHHNHPHRTPTHRKKYYRLWGISGP